MKVQNLCAWYGAAQILFDVDLDVKRGEVVALFRGKSAQIPGSVVPSAAV